MFDKQIKRLKWGDIALVKLSVLFFAFWILTMLPVFRNWVMGINQWIWLILFIAAAAIPVYDMFRK